MLKITHCSSSVPGKKGNNSRGKGILSLLLLGVLSMFEISLASVLLLLGANSLRRQCLASARSHFPNFGCQYGAVGKTALNHIVYCTKYLTALPYLSLYKSSQFSKEFFYEQRSKFDA